MRLFQNSGLYPSYLPRLQILRRGCDTFAELTDAFLQDRFGASHFLAPVLDRNPAAFFTNGDDEVAQRQWAVEHGVPAATSMADILLAQIEHHRTEVFYNLDPMRYGSSFVRRLPACVKAAIAWRAAPSPGADFAAYDRVVCNFPSILRTWQARGWKTDLFSPAHDPVMGEYAGRSDRPIDVLFVGGYTRHHRSRAAILEKVASLKERHTVVYCLDRSRLTCLAESRIGRLLPLGKHRRPNSIQQVSRDPVFGRQLYELLSQARIVLNGSIDMAGEDRGNMRCFEAMGCGALLLSDDGLYPEGMVPGSTLVTYASPGSLETTIPALLAHEPYRRQLADAGYTMVTNLYDKATQWRRFQALVA